MGEVVPEEVSHRRYRVTTMRQGRRLDAHPELVAYEVVVVLLETKGTLTDSARTDLHSALHFRKAQN
jgi:hypothetical protein